MGLGATALSSLPQAAFSPLGNAVVATDNDPLSRFRLFADDGPDEWLKHLHTPRNPRRGLPTGPNVPGPIGGGEDGAFWCRRRHLSMDWSRTGGTEPDFDPGDGKISNRSRCMCAP